jgi:hypothetical protein
VGAIEADSDRLELPTLLDPLGYLAMRECWEDASPFVGIYSRVQAVPTFVKNELEDC